MLRDDIERITSIQTQLCEHLQRIPEPLIMLDGDEDGHVIMGNEAAFIRLAVHSLDVARGSNVAFDPPLAAHDLPTKLLGMAYDADPIVPAIREQPWWGKVVAATIVGAIGVVLATGMIVDFSWIVHQVASVFRR